jgi:hypothetical protein
MPVRDKCSETSSVGELVLGAVDDIQENEILARTSLSPGPCVVQARTQIASHCEA